MRAAPSLSAVALIAVTSLGALAACNDDGRELRPARPDQVGSVSVPSTSTTTGDIDGGIDDGIDDGVGGLGDALDNGSGDGLQVGSPTSVTPQLTSSFTDNGPLDPRFTCDGENISPALGWTAPPTGTVEVAITMIDLDAPGFVHWALAGIDPLSTALGEGKVPEFAIEGLNGAGKPGYTGPCPPSGEHRYQFTVHFLAQQTELGDGSLGADLIAAIDGASFAFARLTAIYSRS